MELELTTCPDCGLPAEVIHRATLESTDGPIEHVKTRRVSGHWFMAPRPRAAEHAPRARRVLGPSVRP